MAIITFHDGTSYTGQYSQTAGQLFLILNDAKLKEVYPVVFVEGNVSTIDVREGETTKQIRYFKNLVAIRQESDTMVSVELSM